jgi:hypothetical protein
MDPHVVEVEGEDLAAVVSQLPRPETLPDGAVLCVHAGRSRRWLGKLLAPRDAPPAHAIGSALLALGYVNVHATTLTRKGDRPAIVGQVPPRS